MVDDGGGDGVRRRTFDCRVIFVDEVALNQLNGQAGFTDTTAADDDQLVLPQKLQNGANELATRLGRGVFFRWDGRERGKGGSGDDGDDDAIVEMRLTLEAIVMCWLVCEEEKDGGNESKESRVAVDGSKRICEDETRGDGVRVWSDSRNGREDSIE